MLALKCPECSSPSLNHNENKGEVICYDCGLVLDDALIKIETPFKSEEDGGGRDGVGNPISNLDPTGGMQTQIGNYSDLKNIPSKQRNKFRRLGIWQRRTISNIEKNFKTAMPEIKRLCSLLNLNSRIEEESARLYRDAAFKGMVRGRAIEVVVAASVYAACRLHEMPVTLKSIAEAYEMFEKKDIGQAFRILSRNLGLKTHVQSPTDYVPRICGKLNLSAKTQTTAIEFLEKCSKDKTTSGKSPISLAASAIYLSCLVNRERRIQAQIAKASDITEVTLRNRHQEMVDILKLTPNQIKGLRGKNNKR